MRWLLLMTMACGLMESPESQLARELVDQQTSLTQLYAAYGGSKLAKVMEDEATKASKNEALGEGQEADIAKAFLEGISGAAAEADRSTFEAHCLSLGKGNKPMFMTEAGREFFAKPEVITSCVEAASRHSRIESLRSELGQ